MDRRLMLEWLVATGGLAAIKRLSADELAEFGARLHMRGDAGAAELLLSPDELRTVTAVAECIIPATETPGATEAGVAAFVNVMLSDWYPAPDAERFRVGLRALDDLSQRRFGAAYADATASRQVELAQELDGEVAALRRRDPGAAAAHWFATLKFLTVWGYCTSEVAMRQVLKSYPRAMRYDGAAPARLPG